MSNIFLFRTYQKDIFDTKIEAKPCPEIQQLEVYWERMHNGKKPPWRTQICPTKLIDMLPFLFLIDLVSENHAYFRFIGASAKLDLEELSIHTPLKNRVYTDTQPRFKTCMTEIFTSSAPQKLMLRPYASSAFKTPLINLGLFPLLDRYGKSTKAIGAIKTDGARIYRWAEKTKTLALNKQWCSFSQSQS